MRFWINSLFDLTVLNIYFSYLHTNDSMRISIRNPVYNRYVKIENVNYTIQRYKCWKCHKYVSIILSQHHIWILVNIVIHISLLMLFMARGQQKIYITTCTSKRMYCVITILTLYECSNKYIKKLIVHVCTVWNMNCVYDCESHWMPHVYYVLY